MSLEATPAEASAEIAPVCRRSVTKSLYFDTTTANRSPAARPEPCIACIRSARPPLGRRLRAAHVRLAKACSLQLPSRLPAWELRLALSEKRGPALAHVVGRRY